jgi:hypothetical protein
LADPGATPTPDCRCVACTPALAELVLPRLIAAVRNLELVHDLATVTVCCDDLPDGDDGWLRLEPVGGTRLTIYCAPRVFDEHSRGGGVTPAPAVWEQSAAPRDEGDAVPDRFSPAETNAFLHHQLTIVADLLRGRLLPDLVPAPLAEAFAAAWDVAVDGRLERSGLPGYDQARRRGRFSGLFSSAGILMPGHWQIFQSLWDGGLESQAEVQAAVRHLPGL